MNQTERWMREALKLAQMAFDADEIPVGCVAVFENQIIGKGYNQTEKLKDPTAHAEMIALTAACEYMGAKRLDKCDLYVTLEPCAMCAGALNWARIQTLYVGAAEPKFGFSKFQPTILHPKTRVVNGILSDESAELLKTFFLMKRN